MAKLITVCLSMFLVFGLLPAQTQPGQAPPAQTPPAQTPPPQTPPSQTPPPQTAPPAQTAPATEVKAAEDLIQMMDMRSTFDQGKEAMIKAQVQANPSMAQFEDLMRQFLDKYLTWDQVKGEFVRIYTDTFTESELRELIELYQTPTGKKLLGSMPEIMNRSMQVTQNQLQPHLPELQQQITARVQEQQKQQQPAPGPGQGQPGQGQPEPGQQQPQPQSQPPSEPQSQPNPPQDPPR